MEKNQITFEEYRQLVYKKMLEKNFHISLFRNKDFDGATDNIVDDIVYALDLDF